MKTQELLRTLAVLRTELAQSAAVDDPSRQRLQSLISEIERGIAEPERSFEASATPTGSFSERMLVAMTDFELRHPQLTATLSNLADQLARMGI